MLLGALAAVGCGYSEDEMQARIQRIDELERQLRDSETESQGRQDQIRALQAQNAELGERLRSLGQTVEGLESERGDLQSSLAETRRALEELRQRERQQAERLTVFRQMLERFASMIAAGRLRVRIVRNRMVIELQNDVLFASARAELQPEGEQALRDIVGVLGSIENRQFQVAGHTDNIPIRGARFASNWELSTTRAVNVVRFMIENGLGADRVSAAGYADTQPVASNASDEGRAQNRRIEIILLPNLDELPDLSSLMEGAS